VLENLRHVCDYVRSVAETQASFTDAVAVIESALLYVKKTSAFSKAELEARNDGLPGLVLLIAKALGYPVTYYWEYSLDQVTWMSVPDTMTAKTRVSGLTSGHTYWFRFRALTPSGPRDYSQVVSLLVH
jgi:hypothetical protein